VSPFLRAAASVMLTTHARNLEKACVGSSELECAPINTDFVESGFAQLDRTTPSNGMASYHVEVDARRRSSKSRVF
jgi:hypothetical protein